MILAPTTISIGLAILGVAILIAWAVRAPHLARMSLRYAVCRPLRAGIIIAGLMLATILVEAALAVNDAILLAVKQVAIAGVGQVDEEVTGGTGPLGLFPIVDADQAALALHHDPQIAGIAPTLLIDDGLVIDETARQVHGDINLLGIEPDFAGPMATFAGGQHIAGIAPGEIWLNARAAELLHASIGDTLANYSVHWAGQTLHLRIGAIVSDGPLGKRPTAFVRLADLQAIANAPDQVNRAFVANAGAPLDAVAQSATITRKILAQLPPGYHIRQSKAEAVTYALQAETLFGRILSLYILFALAVDILLIVLIFALLTVERRSELGTLRAIGLRRHQVIAELLFEAAIYNLAAVIPGALAGFGLGALIIQVIAPTVARLGFPLTVQFAPQTFFLALSLGFLFSLLVTAGAVSLTSRMSIAAALRNQPDPPAAPPTFGALLTRLRQARPSPGIGLAVGGALLWGATWRGIVPIVLGAVVQWRGGVGLLAIGLAITVSGVVLVLRWLWLWQAARRINLLPEAERLLEIARVTQLSDRVAALLIGAYLLLYWGLPGSLARYLAPRRFSGGIESFFIAGLLMVLGLALAITANLDLLLRPFRALAARSGRWRHIGAVGLVTPVAQRLRSGIGLALFALVTFVMVVMASLTNSTTQRFADISNLTGGYDIIGQPLSRPVGTAAALQAVLAQRDPATAQQIQAVSVAAALPLAIIAPGATDAGWRLYPAAEIDGAFVQGAGLPLVARAQGYATDADVWRAVRERPGTVVIDAGALDPDQAAALGIQSPPLPPLARFAAPPIAATLLGPASLETAISRPQTQDLLSQTTPEVRALLSQPERLRAYTLQLSNLTNAVGQLQPTKIWVEDFRSAAAALPLTIVGIIDNVQGQRYGLLGTSATFAPLEAGLSPVGNVYDYFILRAGADAATIARAISSAFLEEGFETTVIRQALQDLNAPLIFASEVLLRLVGLMLLVGMAALMISSLRSVVERRQQIGMLRALGFRRWHIQMVFFIETGPIAVGGALAGTIVGLVLCRNGFNVTFADAAQVGIALLIPWGTIAAIIVLAIALAALAVVIPAWQASGVPPADALRYE